MYYKGHAVTYGSLIDFRESVYDAHWTVTFFYLAFLSSVTVYDTGKIFANNIGRTFYLFKRYSGIPSGSVALFALSDLTILLMSFLEAGGKVKTQGGWPKVFSNRYNAPMFLESFTDFLLQVYFGIGN